MKNLLLILAFTLTSAISYSQYKVQYAENVLIEAENGFSKVKMGQKLNIGTKVFINDGKLQLLDEQNKPHLIQEKGMYILDTLISSKSDNITKMYIDYIVENMDKKEERPNMSLTGSVERSTSKFNIKTYYPERSYIKDRLEIYWKSVEDVKKYNISVYSMFDVEIITAIVKDTSFVLYMDQFFSPGQVYKLIISDKEGDKFSKEIVLECPSEVSLHLLDKEINSVGEYKNEDDYMFYYILGKLYEENGYHFNAVESYKRSLRINDTYLVRQELDKWVK
jgi:hypothetical protein